MCVFGHENLKQSKLSLSFAKHIIQIMTVICETNRTKLIFISETNYKWSH